MNSLFGIKIVPHPLATRTEIRRVKGGYLNRWLIRAEVVVPCAFQTADGTIYMHPEFYARLPLEMRFSEPSRGLW